VVAVTHDRYFLDNVAEWILELDRGKAIPFKGNYSSWLEQKKARLAQEEKGESARQRKLGRELEWVRSSPKARQAKSKARLTAYEQLLNESTAQKRDPNEIAIPPGPRLGDLVFEAENLGKSFGDKLLFENVSFKVPKNAVVGIIGPNGAGKTTLFKMLAGVETSDTGQLKTGESVKLAYVDQSRDNLVGDNTVYKEISGGSDTMMVGKQEISSRAYCGWFNFKGSDQQKLVKFLSGGERNRLHLAKIVKSGGNVLMLDEPTNDLDVETLRSLEAALDDFAGCALVISHDRWFLDRIATHILAFEGDSKVVWFEGNFEAYEEDKKKRLGPDAVQPHRIKYRKLTKD
jgi:ATP-binding cassette ChvD family protein